MTHTSQKKKIKEKHIHHSKFRITLSWWEKGTTSKIFAGVKVKMFNDTLSKNIHTLATLR